MNETLEAMARALFKSWFVDFDPVRAKAEGRQPSGMDAGTAALFPGQFVASPRGDVPIGWAVGQLGDIAENPRRGVRPGEIVAETPYIGLEHMPRRSISLTDWGRAEETVSNKFRFMQGEILFGKLRPYFYKVGVAVTDGVCSTDILVLKPKAPHWYGLLVAYASSDDFVDYTDRGSGGTRMPRTNWSDMAIYEVMLPLEELADAFSKHVSSSVQAIRINIRQSRTLAAIRDALLPKLLSGQIRVKEAEKFVEAHI